MTVEQTPGGSPTVANVMRPLSEAAGWMKLVGTLGIIYGVLMGLTIIGLIVAWLPIWMGILLRGAATEAQAAYASGDETAAVTATSKLQTMFKVQGIIVLVGLVLWAIWLIFIIALVVFGSTSN